MSLDGRYLAIASASTTLVDPPATMTGIGTAVYLWDRVGGGFRLVTRGPNGVGVRGAHTNVVFSPDSRRLAMFAVGTVEYTDARTGQAAQGASAGAVTLLIHEIESGVTKGYVATATNRVLAFSPDGSKLVTTALGNTTTRGLWRIDLATGVEEAITFEAGQARAFESSSGGEKIAFTFDSIATPFVGLLDFASANTNAIASVNAPYPSRPEINADGSIVIFQNYANAPAVGDTNGYPNPFVYDIGTETVSTIANGNGASVGNILSADGSTLLVLSHASDLVVSDYNNSIDVIAYAISAPPRIFVQAGAAGVDLRIAAATALDFVLESATAVDGAPGSWEAVTANQTMEGGSIVVRVSLSDSMRFFRLRK
jgi:WD40 repeat protein